MCASVCVKNKVLNFISREFLLLYLGKRDFYFNSKIGSCVCVCCLFFYYNSSKYIYIYFFLKSANQALLHLPRYFYTTFYTNTLKFLLLVI